MKLPYQIEFTAANFDPWIAIRIDTINKINKKLIKRMQDLRNEGYNLFHFTDNENINTSVLYIRDYFIIFYDNNTREIEVIDNPEKEVTIEQILEILKRWITAGLEESNWYRDKGHGWEQVDF